MQRRINSRAKGCGFERQLAKLFRELGFLDCKTSRFSSKEQDFLGVDFVNTGNLAIQAKAVEQNLNYHSILSGMPQDSDKINLVFHKKNRQGVVVALKQEDFIKILKILLKNS